MKVALIGKKSEFTKAFLERISKEGYEAYLLAEEDYSRKERSVTKHKFYALNSKRHLLNSIFESINPDIVVFAGKDPMGFHQVFHEEWDCEGYIDLLEKVLKSMTNISVSKFIFLSSTAVYGKGNKICTEDTEVAPDSSLGLEMVQGEFMVKQYGEAYGFNTSIIRSDALYGNAIGEDNCDFVNRCVSSILSEDKKAIYGEAFFQPLHVNDLVDAIIRVMENGKHLIYNAAATDVYSIKKEYRKIARALNARENQEEIYEGEFPKIDCTRLKTELEWIDLKKYENLFSDSKVVDLIREGFKKIDKPTKKDSKKQLKTVRQVCENVLIFALFFALYYMSQTNNLFANVDWMILYVVVISVFGGLAQSLIAVSLASCAYLFIEGLSLYEMTNFYSYAESVLMIAEFVFLGIIISYTVDLLRENLRDTHRTCEILEEDYEELKDINKENVLIKNEYEKRLLVSKTGISKLYSLVNKLMLSAPEQIMMEILSVVSEMMETDTVAVYMMKKDSPYLRLVNVLNQESMMEGKTWDITDYKKIQKAIDECVLYEGDIWNNEPAMILPIRYTDMNTAVIVIKNLPYTSNSLYHINLIKTLGLLITDSMARALDYDYITRADRYIGDTDIMIAEEFEKQTELAKKKADAGIAEYSILVFEGDVITVYKEIAYMFRTTDYFGKGEDGLLYVLLNNTSAEEVKNVIERLNVKGIQSRSVQ